MFFLLILILNILYYHFQLQFYLRVRAINPNEKKLPSFHVPDSTVRRRQFFGRHLAWGRFMPQMPSVLAFLTTLPALFMFPAPPNSSIHLLLPLSFFCCFFLARNNSRLNPGADFQAFLLGERGEADWEIRYVSGFR